MKAPDCSRCREGELLFSRQEQAVVYLFSRYWHQIRQFRARQIFKPHTHFPDFSLKRRTDGGLEAIEFEYALSTFGSSHCNPTDRLKLAKGEYQKLYIVYWDEDADPKAVAKGATDHFKMDVELVCLHERFQPCVGIGEDCLRVCWRPRSPGTAVLKEAYPHGHIKAETKKLIGRGLFKELGVDRDLYRTIGFNTNGSAFVELDHWRKIHLFTTETRFGDAKIPGRLFFKPTGWQRFAGCFEVTGAFRVNLKQAERDTRKYFREHYFYSFENTGVARNEHATCFVYRRFIPFAPTTGAELYDVLLNKLKYAIDERGSKVIEQKHMKRVDRICGLR